MTDNAKIYGYRYWGIDDLGRLRSPYYKEYIWGPGENDSSKLTFSSWSSQKKGLWSWWDPRSRVEPDTARYSTFSGPSLVFGTILVDPKNLLGEETDRRMNHSKATVVGVVKPMSARRDELTLVRELKVARTKFLWFGAIPILLGGLATSLFWTHDLTGLWFILAALIAWGFFESAHDYRKNEISTGMAERWKRFEHNYPEVRVFNHESELYHAFSYPDFLDAERTPETDPTFWRIP